MSERLTGVALPAGVAGTLSLLVLVAPALVAAYLGAGARHLLAAAGAGRSG